MSTLNIPVPQAKARPLAAWTRSYVLGDLSSGRTNNFNLLRFFAASLVILSHCSALGWGENPEPIMRYFGALETGGTLGVIVFFAISGYLITQSFVARGGQLKSFLTARFLRVYPGLVAATFFSALLAGLATNVPLREFLTHQLTRRFLLHNSLGYPTEYYLPGAFAGNPIGGAVNGSLWTLPIEMEMYLVIAGLGVFGLFGSREWFNTFFAAFILMVSTVKLTDLPLVYGNTPEVARMGIVFLCGAFFYVNRNHIPVSIPWLIVLLAAIVHWHKVPGIRMLYLPAVAYIALALAYHPKLYFAGFNRLGDYSYGLYIYAYPTQQLIAYYNKGIKAGPLFLFAYPCILAVAILSWKFIEKPMLRLKPTEPAGLRNLSTAPQ
jgi:peptidoglycan/LPS O-acetylase OafA/YrhL